MTGRQVLHQILARVTGSSILTGLGAPIVTTALADSMPSSGCSAEDRKSTSTGNVSLMVKESGWNYLRIN